MLAKGPVLKTEIEEAAEANSISEKTLRRAKGALGVIAAKDRSKPDGKWYWKLPPPAMGGSNLDGHGRGLDGQGGAVGHLEGESESIPMSRF
jgi:hypothetical protein